MRSLALAALLSAGLLQAVALGGERVQARIFQIDYAKASELLPVAQAQLSAEGKISVAESANALIVVDTPEVLDRVSRVLRALDRKPANIKIEVRSLTKNQWERLGIKVSWRFAGDGWMFGSIPLPPGGAPLGLEALASSGQIESRKTQSILVMENRPGRIFTGNEYPINEKRLHVDRNNIYVTESTTFKPAGESLYVIAARAGDGKLKVTVAPESSHLDKETGAFNVNSSSTSVVIDDPGTLVIARSDGSTGGSSIDIPLGGHMSTEIQSRIIILSANTEP